MRNVANAFGGSTVFCRQNEARTVFNSAIFTSVKLYRIITTFGHFDCRASMWFLIVDTTQDCGHDVAGENLTYFENVYVKNQIV